MITKRQFDTIAQVHGLAAAEAAAGPPAPAEAMVDLRCPGTMGKLLGRAQASALPGGIVEIACTNCARRYRAAGVACTRVLHRFNLLGDALSTEIIA